jgi:RecA/RadA recombinase
MADNFWRKMVKKADAKNLSILEDGLGSAEFTGYIDTGSYVLNALLSGFTQGGFPDNKCIGIAGDEATGKTFIALGIERHFLERDDDSAVYHADTESASFKEMIKARGIDPERFILDEPETVEEFRTNVMQFIHNYSEQEERPRLMMCLDSLGNLSTNKEMGDGLEGKDVKDMTRAGLIRGVFRSIRLKLAKVGVPLLVTNHTYAIIGAFVRPGAKPPKEMSGGGGLKYAADIIMFLSKAPVYDENNKAYVGNYITVLLTKSRITREKSKVNVKLSYKTGLDRWYGVLDLAEAVGLVEASAKKHTDTTTWTFLDGTKAKQKAIYADPESFMDKSFLDQMDKMLIEQKTFLYGEDERPENFDDDEDDESFEGEPVIAANTVVASA